MVVAGKIFKVSEALSMDELAGKLADYRTEEPYEEGDYKFNLVTEVVGLLSHGNVLKGVYSHDYIMHVFHRGKVSPLPRTVEAMFSFAKVDDGLFLTVVEKKRLANYVANKLSELLFNRVGVIVEARISPETLRDFHYRNREDTKITFFDNVDIPNVDKLSLYGPDLMNTSLFEEYLKHGDLWYVVARSKKAGYVVGVTRDASVTVFNLADKNAYLEYVQNEMIPLVSASTR